MLDRLSSTISAVTVDGSAVADSEEIGMASYAGGMVFVPSGSGLTTLTYYAAEKPGGTYLAAYDAEGTAITQTVQAERCYPIPTDLYGARAIKITGNTDGTVLVSLKG